MRRMHNRLMLKNTSPKNSILTGTIVMVAIAGLGITGCATKREDAGRMGFSSVLIQFEDTPATGANEAEMPVRKLPEGTNAVVVPQWPGAGLAQHPFLYYGEGNNVLYVVNHGRVAWSYAFPHGGEIDDAWLMSNGHIILTKMTDCYEVTPQKEIVWSYHCPTNTQIHVLASRSDSTG